MNNSKDVMLTSGCQIVLPMFYAGNTLITRSRGNRMVVIIRGKGFQIEEVNAKSVKELRVMLNALVRYASLLRIPVIRYYADLPEETIKMLVEFGFVEEEPVSSRIHALKYYMEEPFI